MHACIHAYIHTCIHAYMHTCIRAYVHTCMHTCIRAYMHTCIHAYMHACIHTYVHTYIHTYIYAYLWTYVLIKHYKVTSQSREAPHVWTSASGVLLHLPHRHGGVQSEGQRIRLGGRTWKIFAGTLSYGGSITAGLCRDAWCSICFFWRLFMSKQQPAGRSSWVFINMKLWIHNYININIYIHLFI